MTVIAAYFKSPADYAIGADEQAECNGIINLGVVKIHQWGSVLFGGWGAQAQTQRAARHMLASSSPTDQVGLDAALCDLHAYLLAHAGPQGSGTIPSVGAGFLFVGPFGIVEVDYSGGLNYHKKYWAGGSGAPIALGMMYARVPAPEFPASESVRLAVKAAICFDAGCGGEPHVLAVEP